MENLSFHRVGKYNDGKNRPIKITLPTKEEALALLKTKSRIPKEATYYLKSDRTKMEKDFLKKVVDELNNRKIRYYNNIPRIVKYRSIPKNSISNNATSSEAPNVSKKKLNKSKLLLPAPSHIFPLMEVTFVYSNINAINTKISELRASVSQDKPDFILLTETWLNSKITDSLMQSQDMSSSEMIE